MKNNSSKKRTLLVRAFSVFIVVSNFFVAERLIVGPAVEKEKKYLASSEIVTTVWNTKDKAIKLVIPFELHEAGVDVPFGIFKHLASSGAFEKGSAMWAPVDDHILYQAKVPDENGIDALYVRSVYPISYDQKHLPIRLYAVNDSECRWAYSERNKYTLRFWSYLTVGTVSLILYALILFLRDLFRIKPQENKEQ